jgi:hypothetical protein
MTTLRQLERAFLKAHEAGDTENAKLFADELRRLTAPPVVEEPEPQPQSGLKANFRAGIERLLGDKDAFMAGFGVPGAAESAAAHRKKAAQIAFTPEFTDQPFEYFKSILGGSLPYMAAPLGIGLAASPLGVPAAIGASGLASAAQFTGSNLTRQLEEGTRPEDLGLGKAAATAVPQAALDVVGFRYIPGIRKIFGSAGVQIGNKEAAGIVEKYITPAFKAAGIEGGTEAGQQVLERLQAGLSLTDPQARKEYFDSFVGGAVLGGTLSIPGSMLEGTGKPPALTPSPTETPAAPTSELDALQPLGNQELLALPAPAQAPQLGYTPPTRMLPAPPEKYDVYKLMESYETLNTSLDPLAEKIEAARAAGENGMARDLMAEYRDNEAKAKALKAKIEELGGFTESREELEGAQAKTLKDIDSKIAKLQNTISEMSRADVRDYDAVERAEKQLEKLKAQRDVVEESFSKKQDMLRVKETPAGEQIPMFGAEEAQPRAGEVLKFKTEKGDEFTATELEKAGQGPERRTDVVENERSRIAEKIYALENSKVPLTEAQADELAKLQEELGIKDREFKHAQGIGAAAKKAVAQRESVLATRQEELDSLMLDEYNDNLANTKAREGTLKEDDQQPMDAYNRARHEERLHQAALKVRQLQNEIDALKEGETRKAVKEKLEGQFSSDELYGNFNILNTAINNNDQKTIDRIIELRRKADRAAFNAQHSKLTPREEIYELLKDRIGGILRREKNYDTYEATVDGERVEFSVSEEAAKEITRLRNIVEAPRSRTVNGKKVQVRSLLQQLHDFWDDYNAREEQLTALKKAKAPADKIAKKKEQVEKAKAKYQNKFDEVAKYRQQLDAELSKLYKKTGEFAPVEGTKGEPTIKTPRQKQEELEKLGKSARDTSRQVKTAANIQAGKVKVSEAKVAQELGETMAEYQAFAAPYQKRLQAKVDQFNKFINTANERLAKLKETLVDANEVAAVEKQLNLATKVRDAVPDENPIEKDKASKKVNSLQEHLKVVKTPKEDKYKLAEANLVKIAKERRAELDALKAELTKVVGDKAVALGKQHPDFKAKLAEAKEEYQESLQDSVQEVKSLRTPQVTRKIAKLGSVRTSSEESKAASQRRQEAFEADLSEAKGEAFDYQQRQEAIERTNRKRIAKEGKGTAMEVAMTKAAQEKVIKEVEAKEKEQGKFARGVEVESPDLTAEQIKMLEANNLSGVLRSIANDPKASELNRVVAARLAGILDATNVVIKDKLFAPDGKEVLGEAISTQIQLSRNGGLSQEVLLHEATHAAVERVIQMPDSMLTKEQIIAKRELMAMFNAIKNDPKITSANAKSSLSEFAAEIFSNRNLQEQLRNKKWRGSSLWEGLKSVILRMLGIKNPETMLGAALKSVDLLMIPSSSKIGLVEKPANRKYSAKDIAALHTGSNSMKQFAEQFGPEIKQKDRTPEDVDRIANEQLNRMLRDPEKIIPQADVTAIDWDSFTRMPDGRQYSAASVDDFFTADPRVISYASMDGSDQRQEVNDVNKKRLEDQADLITYLRQNPDYTLAEQALVAKAASKYSVIADKDGRLKVVSISKDNLHPVAVIGHDSANAIIEELRAGKGLKDAFIDGLQKRVDRNKQLNLGKQGWKKFNQITANEAEASTTRFTDQEIHDAWMQTGYAGDEFGGQEGLVEQLINEGLLPNRRPVSINKEYDAAVALNAGAAGTSWCTGKDVGTAKEQLQRGDFYIYYDNGRPEVAIRMDGKNSIGEIRGNTPNQSVSNEQQKIATAFLKKKNFAGAQEYLDDVEFRSVMLDAIKTGKTLTPEQTIRFFGRAEGDIKERMSQTLVSPSETFTGGFLEASSLFGYGTVIDNDVVKEVDKVFARSAAEAYSNGYFFMDEVVFVYSGSEGALVAHFPTTHMAGAKRKEFKDKFERDTQAMATAMASNRAGGAVVNGKKMAFSSETPEQKAESIYNALNRAGDINFRNPNAFVKFVIPLKDVKALSQISFAAKETVELPQLVHVDTISFGSTDEALILPKVKNINEVLVGGRHRPNDQTGDNVPILAVEDGTQIKKIEPQAEDRMLLLSGDAFIHDLKLTAGLNRKTLSLVAPDITRIGSIKNEANTYAAQSDVIRALSSVLPDFARSAQRWVTLKKDGSFATASEDSGAAKAVQSYGEDSFKAAADPMSKLAKELYKLMSPTNTARFHATFDTRIASQIRFATETNDFPLGVDTSMDADSFLRLQVNTLLDNRDIEAANKNIGKIKNVLRSLGVEESEIGLDAIKVGELTAPELKQDEDVVDAEYVEVPEQPRYAPKDVGVQEEKPGFFSFRSKEEPTNMASSFVGTSKSVKDTLMGNVLGLTGRVQFIDRFAALSEAFKKGKDAGVISSLEATQGEYYLRFGEQRSQYATESLTNGTMHLKKLADGKGYIYESRPGANMIKVADALSKAGIKNDTQAEAMFTAYVAGLRAEKVGWDKLNLKDPAESKAEHAEVMAYLKQNTQARDAFVEANKIYQEYNNGLIDFLVQTGAMSQKQAAELKALPYVPYYRVRGDVVELMVDKERPVRIGNIKDEPELQQLVGSNDQIMPIFTSAVQNTFILTNMALRNQMIKDSSFLLHKLGIASSIGKSTKTVVTNKKEIEEAAKAGKVIPEKTKEVSVAPDNPNIVRFKVNGEDHYALINSNDFGIPADLIVKGMEGIKTTLPFAIKAMGVPADILRKFVTRNPAYAIKQAIRDPLTAWMTTGTSGIPVLNGFKELSKMVAGRSEEERKLMASGAISSNVFTGDQRDMDKALRDVVAGKQGWTKWMARADAFAMQGDAATRAVVYKDSLAKGLSEMEALLRTLESMNFSRRGLSPSMQALSVMIPFFNAQIQGLDVLYRAFRGEMPFNEQLEIRKKLFQRGLMLAAGTMAYAAMMQDDEAYKNAKPEERLANWFVYIPGEVEPLKIPIPFELGYLFKALPEAVFNMAAEDRKSEDITNGMGKLLWQSVPIGMPQAIKPAVELYLNKSFYAGDIESQREQKTMLPTERSRETTTELAKLLGSLTGDAGITPIGWDHLTRGYTGGLGVALVALANPLLNTEAGDVAKPTKKMHEQPFIGGFFQPVEGRGTLDAGYERMLEIQQAKGTYTSLLMEGKRDQAREFLEEYRNKIAYASLSGSVQQRLGELSKMRRNIIASPMMTEEQKTERVEKIDKVRNDYVEKFLSVTD